MTSPSDSGPRAPQEGSAEPHQQTDDTTASREILEGQLRECFGRVVYSHKTHEKCADILLDQWSKIKLAQMILSGATTGGFVAAIFGGGQPAAILGTIVSVSLLVLNSYTKNYDHGQLAQKHKQSAAALWLIRERYLSLLTDLRMGERPIEFLQTQRDALLEELHPIYVGAPATTNKAYKRAQLALQKQEDLTFTTEEIDAFLPKELRRTPKPGAPNTAP